jgi:hypothetical protein
VPVGAEDAELDGLAGPAEAFVSRKFGSLELERAVPLVPVAPAVPLDEARWTQPVTVIDFAALCEDDCVGVV